VTRFSRISAGARRAFDRDFLLAAGPFLLFVLLIWAKLSYFNFPPNERLETDWVDWRLKEAVQAWASTLAGLLILLSPLLLLRPLARYLVLAAIDVLVSALVLADLLHYRFYGDVISVSAVGTAGQVGGVMDSVLVLLSPTDAFLVADLLLAAIAFPLYRRAVRRVGGASLPSLRPLIPRAVVAGVVLLLAAPVRIVALDRGDTFRYNYLRLFGVRKIGLLNYHAYEAGRKYVNGFIAAGVDPADRQRALDYVAALRAEATAPSELFGAAKGKNVIFVMIESFHAFPLGLRVEGQEVTPVLNDLAGKSLNFTNFYGQAWEGTTSDGEFTSLQSLYPLPSGAVATTYPYHNYRAVPKILAERGYSTMSAHAYYGSLWNIQEMHPALGFQKVNFREKFRITEEIGMGLSDREFFEQVEPWVAEMPEPFMAYLITLSSHHPWDLPAKYRALRLGSLDGTMVGGYLQSARYVDTALGEFIQDLKYRGLWDNTVLVLYGDHRAEIEGKEDIERLLTTYAGYPPRAAGFDARYWGAANRLAFMVHLPGDAGAGEYRMSGGHLDIAPTVLNLLGVEDHQMVTLGRDLTQRKDALVVMRSGAFVLGDTVCVTPSAEIAREECRTLTTNASLPVQRFAPRFEEARKRLETSDLILTGDLIPAHPSP
jgi:lipoteichoic acid synthase